MKYCELVEKIGRENIAYNDLLQTDEWIMRRNEIVNRDKNQCTKCGSPKTFWYNGGNYFTLERWRKVKGGSKKILISSSVKTDHPIYLHVHHKYYILERLPWEYGNTELITLCDTCHWELHQEEGVKIYEEKEDGNIELDYTLCSKCKGAGVFPEYSHIQSGICFRCNGSRFEELIDKTIG
ncbi:hypothetical protein [uncultured Draconibacterium sp.]|uniref:hypothetical protein n=1 Tax=uncultured Draconibacterium sp. TaxID=1573823 RepID=UPI0032178FD7